jgi:hypothetical protein
MGVSLTGQRLGISAARHGLATAVVVLGLGAALYGPPFLPGISAAAHRECNTMTGSSFRGYVLEWRTTTMSGLDRPHWVCRDLREPGHPAADLGWWVGL